MAPVPWTLPVHFLGERYYRYSQVPDEESCEGFQLRHPRFFVFPKVFKSTDALLMAAHTAPILSRVRDSFPFDVIDAHWAYPDGVAAAILARFFRVPLALTVRGDDINVLSTSILRRQAIRWALRRAALVIALSNELSDRVQLLGAAPHKTVVIPNGVNSDVFHPGDRSEARRRLGISQAGRMLLSVGRLHDSKGYPLLVEAFARVLTKLPDLKLAIVGESDHEADALPAIEATAARLGVTHKVRLVGGQPQVAVADWYRAADLFCLPTCREGSANVLLEALACGLPCITTPVGGNPDVISTPDVGILVASEVEQFTRAIAKGLACTWDHDRIAAHVRDRTWSSVAEECYQELTQVVSLSRQCQQ